MSRGLFRGMVLILCLGVRLGAQSANMALVREDLTPLSSTSVPGSRALDGAAGFLWDVDGDGDPELVGFLGDRLLVQRSNGTVLAWIDGRGSELWKQRRPLMLRVGAQRYVVVKPGASGPAPWNAHAQLHVVPLFSDPSLGYTAGQVAATAPFAGTGGDDQVFAVMTPDLAAVDPGQTCRIVAVSRNICTIRTYDLAVASNGALSLLPAAAVPCPSGNWIGGNGCTVQTITDAQGGTPESFLFATDIRRLSDLAVVASWTTHNGLVVPVVQGGTKTLSFGYTVLNHIDGCVVVNRGTAGAPLYWIYALSENGEVLGATLTKTPAGVLSIQPVFATRTASFGLPAGVPGAQHLTVTRVAGLGSDRRLVAGRYVFDLDGQILADMNAQVSDPTRYRNLSIPRAWWTTPAGAALRDDQYGFVIENGGWVQRYPYPSVASRPFRGPMFHHLWEWAPGLSWTHPPSFRQGSPHYVADVFTIGSSGALHHRLLTIRTQGAAALLAASDEQPLLPGPLTPGQRDLLLTQVQHAHHLRASDTADLETVLGW